MRKLKKRNFILATVVLALIACTDLDESFDTGFVFEKPASVILDEKLNGYDVLKAYAKDLVLGVKTSADNISENGTMMTLISSNFKQITPISELNSDEILLDNGTCDFSSIETFLTNAKELGVSVFGGDGIISNLNQNDSYLKSIGSSITFLTPLFPNIVDHSLIENGNFSGWNVNGEVSVVDYMGLPAIKFTNGRTVSASEATSLQSPVYSVDENAKFELTFYLLSDKVGEGRVVFSGLNNNEPEMDWTGKGTPSATFITQIGWNKIQIQTSDFDDSGDFSFRIELGYTPNVNYYLSIPSLSLVDLNGSVENPDEIFLECEDAQQIGQWMVLEEDETASGGKALVGIIDGDIEADDTGGGYPSDPNNQDLQFTYTFNVKTTGTYRIWIRQKAYMATNGYDSFFMSVDGAKYYCPGWPAWGDDTNTTSWTWLKLYTDSSDKEGSSLFYFEEGEHTLSIRIREGGHYFDRVYVTMTTNEPSGKGSAAISQQEITLEVSDEVKKLAVEDMLSNYISTVLTNLSDKIKDWTIVKNPFDDEGNIAFSGGSEVDGTFYWADFIGEEYIAQSFSVARANVPSDAKLFIGEKDLNTNENKLSSLISAVAEIPEIDGIAIDLELNLDSDLELIENMFEELTSTGKLIYISSLSVSIPDQAEESYAAQSNVYRNVIDLYMSIIPDSQRYGITFFQVVDSEIAFTGLWDSNYNRKISYGGVCDALIGN